MPSVNITDDGKIYAEKLNSEKRDVLETEIGPGDWALKIKDPTIYSNDASVILMVGLKNLREFIKQLEDYTKSKDDNVFSTYWIDERLCLTDRTNYQSGGHVKKSTISVDENAKCLVCDDFLASNTCLVIENFPIHKRCVSGFADKLKKTFDTDKLIIDSL